MLDHCAIQAAVRRRLIQEVKETDESTGELDQPCFFLEEHD